MGDLNNELGSANTLLRHEMGKHGIGDRNDNGWKVCAFLEVSSPGHW